MKKMKPIFIVKLFLLIACSASAASDLGEAYICVDNDNNLLSSVSIKELSQDGNMPNKYRINVTQGDQYSLRYTARFYDGSYSSRDGELNLTIKAQNNGLFNITLTDYGNTTTYRGCDAISPGPGGITAPGIVMMNNKSNYTQ